MQEQQMQAPPPGALDSITLGQLKALVGTQPRARQLQFDFRYEDEDSVFHEIEEFYSYIETPQIKENIRAWQGFYPGEWTKTPFHERKAVIASLLDSLGKSDTDVRFTAARRLLYVIQGTFAETTSHEHQLHWIIENCKAARAVDGVGRIIEALKTAGSKHDMLQALTEAEAFQLGITHAEKVDYIEEINTEISIYLNMVYMLLQIFKGDEDFGEELMSMEPPFPVYCFGLVAALKDRNSKGYPVKKMLLVAWKAFLTCTGGVVELHRARKIARELADLQPIDDSGLAIKSNPIDFQAFRHETSAKYPTFTPEPTPEAAAARLSEAIAPIPLRAHYNHGTDGNDSSVLNTNGQYIRHGMGQMQSMQQQPQVGPMPGTPAPTPPPSPKPKKQQYQTDQTKPFVFPFSRASRTSNKLVPFAIDEADRLYARHMHISLSLFQMWRTREDCMLDDSGLSAFPGAPIPANQGGQTEWADRKFSIVSLPSTATPTTSAGDEGEESLPDVRRLDDAIEAAEKALKIADANGDRSERRRLKERRGDLVRLRRIETIYSATLPLLQGLVLVLLKLLLATVSANSQNQNPQSATSNGFPPPSDESPAPPLSLEEVDVLRHREVTCKAVSAMLLLTLKWFKVSHVMKFHHMGQLLLDSNCLLLILKMFGLQEVSNTIVTRNELPEHNFFQFCYLHFSKNPVYRPEENQLQPIPSRVQVRPGSLPNGIKIEEETELISDFSWRNFFASVNFIKVMQKLSKHRSHRIWLLVQYKSSAILKRILKVSHPMLQLHVLKLIKSQVPFCGRKWRQSNMKVITSIYLNCRPDLRDEWLTGNEVDDVGDALAQEQALRTLVKFYNAKRYGNPVAQHISPAHRRSASASNPMFDGLHSALHSGPELSSIRPATTPVESDVFPPLRARAPDPSIFLPYTAEDIAFEEEYEEYLSDLGEDQAADDDDFDYAGTGLSAWQRLSNSFGSDMGDGISDSESVVSIGDLGGEVREGERGDMEDENKNNWEHMSPKTLSALPKSPATGGRRSSGSSLRPVIPFALDDGSAIEDDDDLVDDQVPEVGPIPKERSVPYAAREGGEGVDEVEYLYGE